MKKFLDLCLNIIIVVLYISTGTIMVVVLTGTVYYFYKESDTLIAGIIAFVGAIIGGSLTLIGVRITLNENKKSRENETLPLKIAAIKRKRNYIYRLLLDIDYLKAEEKDETAEYFATKYDELIKSQSEMENFYLGKKLHEDYVLIIDLVHRIGLIAILLKSSDESELIDDFNNAKNLLFEVVFNFKEECDEHCNKLINEYYN